MPDRTPQRPHVEFRGEALSPTGITADAVATLVCDLAEAMWGESLPVVRRVVVADFALYGDAIRAELGGRPGPTHTDRPEYQGLAITLPQVRGDGRIDHTIVIVAGAIAAALGRTDLVTPLMPKGHGRYLVQHELAHCRDHLLRGVRSPVGLTDRGEFSIRRVGDYHGPILMAELAACVMAGTTVDDETFDLLLQLDADPLEGELRRILDRRSQYRTRQTEDLCTLAFDSAECCWLILIQFAKTLGHMIGADRTEAKIRFPRTIAENPRAMAAIDRLATLLGERTMSYPDWPPGGWPELSTLWSDLAASLGFRFEITEHGDALWLDDPAD